MIMYGDLEESGKSLFQWVGGMKKTNTARCLR